MATTDSNGILLYEDTDAVSPLHTLLNTGQASVSNALNATARIFPTTSVVDRNAKATAYGPSVGHPFISLRADAVAGRQIEYTTDGSTWIVNMVTKPIAQATKSSAQNTSATWAWTAVLFNTETYDTDAFHSTSSNTSRLTCPTDLAGYYQVHAKAACDTGATSLIAAIYKNGTPVPGSTSGTPASGTSNLRVSSTITIPLAVGDYVELFTSASAAVAMVPTDCLFEISYVRPI